MKMSNQKMKNMLAVLGVSSSLLLVTACDDTYEVNGKKVNKTIVDGDEGYYDEQGVFIPYNFKVNSSKSGLGSGANGKGGSTS